MAASSSSLKLAVRAATATPASACVIFSHGLGDSSAGWEFLADILGSTLPYVNWVFPNAPLQRCTLNGGMIMPSWYDIYTLGSADLNQKEDEEGLLKSVGLINQVINEQIESGIPANRIVVGGFSQGSVISLLTGLTSERKLAGIAALSSYLPLHQKLPQLITENGKETPIFMAHGTEDPVIRYDWPKKSIEEMKKSGVNNIQFETYPGMEHGACPEELEALSQWLKKVIPQN